MASQSHIYSMLGVLVVSHETTTIRQQQHKRVLVLHTVKVRMMGISSVKCKMNLASIISENISKHVTTCKL